ncbi:hypothetical protein ISCGN_006530 [Ixodes scapularis]
MLSPTSAGESVDSFPWKGTAECEQVRHLQLSAYPEKGERPGHTLHQNGEAAALKDTRLREAGAEAVYCLARGAPKGPNIPRAQLNHQGPLFPGHGYATHSQTWVGEPTWLGVRSDATHQAPTKVGAPCVRVWWPTWLGSVVTLLTKHLAPKVQAPPAGLGVRGDATLQTPAFTASFCWPVEPLVAEREESDPARRPSSPDLGPPSSIGSSGEPEGDPLGSAALTAHQDTHVREAGTEAVYCLARGAPKGPDIPRVQLNHQGPHFPEHGYATHSQTWVGEPTWLGVCSDATHQAPTKVGAPCVRVWWPTWLGSVVTLLTKHLAPEVQAPPAGLGVRGDATLQAPAFTGAPCGVCFPKTKILSFGKSSNSNLRKHVKGGVEEELGKLSCSIGSTPLEPGAVRESCRSLEEEPFPSELDDKYGAFKSFKDFFTCFQKVVLGENSTDGVECAVRTHREFHIDNASFTQHDPASNQLDQHGKLGMLEQ